MSSPNILWPVKLPSDLAIQLKGAVDEALKSLGNEAAVLIAYYARSRHNVAFNELPVGIEELDNALAEILGPRGEWSSTNAQGYSTRNLGWSCRLEPRNSPTSFAKSKNSTREHQGPTYLTFLERTH